MKSRPPPPDFDENPEWTEADFARAKPFAEGFPEFHAAWKNRGGRPPVEQPKLHIGFRLAAEIVTAIRASGKGYTNALKKCCAMPWQMVICSLGAKQGDRH